MNEQKTSISIPIAIIVAGALIAGGIYFSGKGKSAVPSAANNQVAPAASLDSIKPLSVSDHVLGDPKAPVVIIEYSDIECPFCKQFHTTLHQLMKDYGTSGKLAWAFRNFPVHTNSIKEAEAAECAAEQGGNDAFWKYTDKLFETTTSNNGLDLAKLPAMAEEMGLDKAKFEACLSSGRYTAKIEKDRADVLAAGAQGTPYSVIFAKNEKIPLTQGALPYSDMKSILDTVFKSL